jgi:hypothetical protein
LGCALAQSINGQIRGHAPQPEREVFGGLNGLDVLVQAQEHILCEIVRLIELPQHAQAKAMHHPLMRAHQRREGLSTARLGRRQFLRKTVRHVAVHGV